MRIRNIEISETDMMWLGIAVLVAVLAGPGLYTFFMSQTDMAKAVLLIIVGIVAANLLKQRQEERERKEKQATKQAETKQPEIKM